MAASFRGERSFLAVSIPAAPRLRRELSRTAPVPPFHGEPVEPSAPVLRGEALLTEMARKGIACNGLVHTEAERRNNLGRSARDPHGLLYDGMGATFLHSAWFMLGFAPREWGTMNDIARQL